MLAHDACPDCVYIHTIYVSDELKSLSIFFCSADNDNAISIIIKKLKHKHTIVCHILHHNSLLECLTSLTPIINPNDTNT